MRISTMRFLIYVILLVILMPEGSGEVALAWGVFYYLFMMWLTLRFMKMDSIWLRFWIPDVKSGVLKGLKVFPLFFLVVLSINLLFPVQLAPQNGEIPFLIFAVITLSLAPVAEEFIFRGYIQEYLRQRFKGEVTVIVSALIFALFHPLEYFPQIFVVGVFLSALREYTNSILPGIVVHALNNTLAVLSVVFSP